MEFLLGKKYYSGILIIVSSIIFIGFNFLRFDIFSNFKFVLELKVMKRYLFVYGRNVTY